MMNKSLLNLAVLCGTVSFGQLPNAIEIAPKMYPGWNLGSVIRFLQLLNPQASIIR